ncbi:porin family protein [Bradyrhizobium diazoefficiens]|nr:outer membrane beta-barrel protein [Bradyrhizobium diazoefficiens]UCF52193.1 MAG: porin family protein [Bradyrhizobium sp.]MBR0963380.1 porin family protein [Bradyrhizobium diazoefficiens]MBR0976194.1 porin family protein [Bradyrhizobium diazoefficiens]MBR1007042.1 porin family protein [Bradyrhizobium diazoefficiens]MBR1013153.1 porin family protein [Bradyrhizobium diazoefficiens]
MPRSPIRRRSLPAWCLTGLGLALAGGAQAADLAPKPFTKAPPLATSSWTGFYAGLGLGFRSTSADLTTTSVLEDGVPRDLTGGVLSQPFNGSGFRANPYAGYNWQVTPNWVVGIEGDVGFGDQSTRLDGYRGTPVFGSSTYLADGLAVKTTWDASLRGRAGYLLTPTTLIYATGGLAWQHYDITSTCVTLICTGNGVAPAVVSNATTRTGWTLGGGLETALWGNWLLRGEYRYADFGTAHFAIARTATAGPALTVQNFDARLATHTASVGLAYKFGEPVIGRAHPLAAQAAILPSWAGVYAGLGLGARATRTDLIATSETIGGGAFDLTERANNRPMDNTAFRASPYAGYLWQLAPQWIVGVEGDVGFADRTTRREGFTSIFLADSQSPGESLSIRNRWDASLRLRGGYLVNPRTMLYATGGVAWQNFELTSTCTSVFCPGFFGLSPGIISQSTTKTGWTVGGGVETALWGNWLARAEYRYADYGKTAFTVARSSTIPDFNPSVNTYDVAMRSHLATFGVTYRFQ